MCLRCGRRVADPGRIEGACRPPASRLALRQGGSVPALVVIRERARAWSALVTTEEELDVHYHGVVVSCEPWSLEFLNLGRYDDPHAGVRTLHAGDVVCVRPGVAWQWKNNSKSVRT